MHLFPRPHFWVLRPLQDMDLKFVCNPAWEAMCRVTFEGLGDRLAFTPPFELELYM
jgi:hypothetical protein